MGERRLTVWTDKDYIKWLEAQTEKNKGGSIRSKDRDSGVSLLTRLGMSFIREPKAQHRFLSGRLKPGEELVDFGGEFGVRTATDIKPVDPGGFRISDIPGDVADIIGYLPELVGSIAGGLGGGLAGVPGGPPGILASSVLGSAAGGVAGEQARQGVAGYIAGEEQSMGKLARAAVESGIGEGAGRGVAMLGSKAIGQVLKPLARSFKRSANVPELQATREAAKAIGINPKTLPVSAQTSSPFARQVEQYTRESPITGAFVEREIDKPGKQELLKSLGRIRHSIGGVPKPAGERIKPRIELTGEFPLLSGIDANVFEKALTGSVESARKAAKKVIDKAYARFEEVGMFDMPVEMAKTKVLLDDMLGGLKKFPELEIGSIANISKLRQSLNRVETVADFKQFKEIVGKLIFDRDTYGNQGRSIFRSIMSDWDDIAKQIDVVSKGEFVGKGRKPTPEAAGAFRSARGFFADDVKLNESKLVRKIFGVEKDVDLELIDDATTKVFRSKSKQAIKSFFRRIGAEETPMGIPATRQGKAVKEMMKQLYLDTVIRETSTMPGELSVRAKGFHDAFFGAKGLGESTTNLIYGAQDTKLLKNFAQVLLDENVAKRLFANYPRTDIRAETGRHLQFLNPWKLMNNILSTIEKKALAKQFVRPQGEEAFLGREFFTEGKMPDVYKFFRSIGRKGGLRSKKTLGIPPAVISRVISQGAVRSGLVRGQEPER